MKFRRILAALLVCAAVFSCTIAPAGAAEVPETGTSISRVSGSIRSIVPKNNLVFAGDWFYLSRGDLIKFDCTYSPASASMDFGVIAPDGLFYPVNTTSGSFNESIWASQSGQYMLAIRNNEDYDVTVTGTVKY